MRGPQELVDRQQFLQPVSALLQGCARRARSCRDRTRRRPRAAPSSAPARPTARPRRRAADRAARHRSHRAPPPSADCGRDRGARRSPAHPVGAPPLRPRQRSACHSRTATTFPGRPIDSAPTPANRSASRDASPAHSRDRGAHGLLGAPGGLQEGPGRRLDAGLAKQKKRRAAHDDGLGRRPVAPAQPRQVGAFGQRHQRLAPFQRQVETLVRPQQQVDAAVGLVHHGIGRRAVRQDRATGRSARAPEARQGSAGQRRRRRHRRCAGSYARGSRQARACPAGAARSRRAAARRARRPEAARSAARRRRVAPAHGRSARPSRRCRRRAANAAGRSRRRP